MLVGGGIVFVYIFADLLCVLSIAEKRGVHTHTVTVYLSLSLLVHQFLLDLFRSSAVWHIHIGIGV